MCLATKPTVARPAFDTQQQAAQWMYSHLEDEHCVDNFRFAFKDDEKAVLKYNEAESEGCCGFFDQEVLVGGRLAIIGCNYGH